MSRIALYKERYHDIPGYFDDNDIYIWNFLFEQQEALGISGGFLEIGLLCGKSSLFGSLYMKPEEPVCLIDCCPGAVGTILEKVSAFHPENNIGIGAYSRTLKSNRELMAMQQKFRFVHIDGDHTGYSLTNDLEATVDLVSEFGIVALDDFMNPSYPQLTAAVYHFLFKNQFQWKMVLNAGAKCYLVRAHAYDAYEKLIREKLPQALEANKRPQTLRRSSYSHDYGCFSLVLPDPSGRKLIGMDGNIDCIPY